MSDEFLWFILRGLKFSRIHIFYKLIGVREIRFLVVPKTQMTAVRTVQKAAFGD